MQILDYHSFYLVGIKGVAMASLAQCLLDAGKEVRGCDVAEKFVTQTLLEQRQVMIDEGFNQEFPVEVDCVIYTAAHQGKFNPQVLKALDQGLPTFSQAEALASLFNQKKGIAVCGVGGKSTTSAMISWILSRIQPSKVSFSVGVGNIPGLEKTGQWSHSSEYFVAEADEYVIDPSAPSRGEEITPRFSFMKPEITVCTNLRFDHPDVYRDFNHTQQVYRQFFSQIKAGGTLIINSDDEPLMTIARSVAEESNVQLIGFGHAHQGLEAAAHITNFTAEPGKTITTFSFNHQEYRLELIIPGQYNAFNAVGAVLAAQVAGIPIAESIQALQSFRSTVRRAEFIGEKNGVKYYDDYGHHPNEVKQVITAFKEWYPNSKLVVAFQSHTFSRTKALFEDFVGALAVADEIAMIDIFPSAREPFDPSITSDMLCEAIKQHSPGKVAMNYQTLEKLASYLKGHLKAGDVCLTLGAGDIYKVHELI